VNDGVWGGSRNRSLGESSSGPQQTHVRSTLKALYLFTHKHRFYYCQKLYT